MPIDARVQHLWDVAYEQGYTKVVCSDPEMIAESLSAALIPDGHVTISRDWAETGAILADYKPRSRTFEAVHIRSMGRVLKTALERSDLAQGAGE